MKKILSVLAMALLTAAAVFAQDNSAPDQNEGVTNVPLSNAAAIVTPEREVTAVDAVVYNDGKTDYVSAGVKFLITARDEGAGIKSITAMADDGSFGSYSAPLTFDKEGAHSITYRVEDNVGNLSPVKSYSFVLDLTAPAIGISLNRQAVKVGDTVYVGSNFTFALFAQDALSGVKGITYSVDGEAEKSYSADFAITGSNGLHSVVFTARDNVGNMSVWSTNVYFLDITPPSLDFTVDPVPFDTNGVRFISTRTLVKINSSDAESGVSAVLYSIDGGEYRNYTVPFTLSAGSHTVKARAYDMLGNETEVKEISLTVDAGAPEADVVPGR